MENDENDRKERQELVDWLERANQLDTNQYYNAYADQLIQLYFPNELLGLISEYVIIPKVNVTTILSKILGQSWDGPIEFLHIRLFRQSIYLEYFVEDPRYSVEHCELLKHDGPAIGSILKYEGPATGSVRALLRTLDWCLYHRRYVKTTYLGHFSQRTAFAALPLFDS